MQVAHDDAPDGGGVGGGPVHVGWCVVADPECAGVLWGVATEPEVFVVVGGTGLAGCWTTVINLRCCTDTVGDDALQTAGDHIGGGFFHGAMAFWLFLPDDIAFFVGDAGDGVWLGVDAFVGEAFIRAGHLENGDAVGQTAEAGRNGLVGDAVVRFFNEGGDAAVLGELDAGFRPDVVDDLCCYGVEGLLKGVADGDVAVLREVGISDGVTVDGVRRVVVNGAGAHVGVFKRWAVNEDWLEGRAWLAGGLPSVVVAADGFLMAAADHAGDGGVFVVENDHPGLDIAGWEWVVAFKVVIHVALEILIQAGVDDVAAAVEFFAADVEHLHAFFDDVIDVALVVGLGLIAAFYNDGGGGDRCVDGFIVLGLVDDAIVEHGGKNSVTAHLGIVWIGDR